MKPKFCKLCGKPITPIEYVHRYDEQTGEPSEYKTLYLCDFFHKYSTIQIAYLVALGSQHTYELVDGRVANE